MVEIINFKKNTNPKDSKKKKQKRNIFESYMHFVKVEKRFLIYLKVEYFHYHQGFYHQGAGFKILNLKQMLRRLPIALAQVKAGNASQNLLNLY